MGITAFPVVSGAQLTSSDSTAKMEPGTIMACRSNTDQWRLVEYVQLDNNGTNKGYACVQNFATLKNWSVKTSAVTDGGGPLKGIACATIASQYFGFITIGGYCDYALQSNTTASGEYLALSASTAGCLSNDKASCFNLATVINVSGLMVVGRANDIVASAGYGSISLVGIWG